MFRPDESPKDNCVTECKYYYYFNYLGQYKCTVYPQCPEEAKLFIKEKNKCLDDCLKDNDYKYQYNGNCLLECPKDTINDNYICREKGTDICTLSTNEMNSVNLATSEGAEVIIKNYINEHTNTNNHISQYKISNNQYNMIVFKNSSCISNLTLKISDIDFGDCYNKLKEYYKIDDDLIIAIVENYKLIYKNNPMTTFALFNPITGEKLNAVEICKNDSIIVNESFINLLDENSTNFEYLLDLIEQGINIFDPFDDFYTDLCYYFISPIKKDIPVKDRIEAFYPNITLCDSGCKNLGINFTSKSVMCDCNFNDISNNALLNNDILGDTTSEIVDIINSSNIEVIKCLIKAFKYFRRGFGGYIIIALTALSIIFTLLFIIVQFSNIKLYIFELTKNYLSLISKLKKSINTNTETKNVLLFPPKKKVDEDEKSEKDTKKKKFQRKVVSKRNNVFYARNTFRLNEKLKIESEKKGIVKSGNLNDFQEFEKFKKGETIANSENYEQNENFFEIYLSKPIEEMDYNDAIKYDKRSFTEAFRDLILEKVMTLNTFLVSEPLKPFMVKLVIYLLYIDLFLIINGLFFSEDYISKVYHLEKEDKFFSFVPRSIYRFLYTMTVSVIINFLINCFFIEEKKIKRIFIRERDNENNLKNDIINLLRIIKERLITFFIITFIIFIFSFLYIICFNYVYHYTQKEWIISSIFIIIIIELIVIIISLLEICLRFLSFKCKSERLYKLSNLLNEL